jgi:hypothetical protein
MRKARNQAGFKISLELFVFRFGGLSTTEEVMQAIDLQS